MDYLRNLGSAAASSLLQKSGITLPFSLGEKVIAFEGKTIWSLHDAVKRDDSSLVSVFVFDAGHSNKRSRLPLAKNALRKLRTIRHPDVLKFVDVVETETTIHIVTERVQPLVKALHNSPQRKNDWIVWGLHRVATALAFVNESCASTHGNVRVDSVFVASSGEWRLGGFDLLSNSKDDAAVLYTLGGLIPDSSMYASPEVVKSGWSVLKDLAPHTFDAYGLGLLIHGLFNTDLPLPSNSATIPPSRGLIPASLFAPFKRLLNPSTKSRLTPKAFLDMGTAAGGFFYENPLVKICKGLSDFALAGEGEKLELLRTLKESSDSFPPSFTLYLILPSLLTALQHAGTMAPSLLPLILHLSSKVPPSDYNSLVLTPLVKLFASPDRGTRMALLDHLTEFADKLDEKAVVADVWPHLQTGFTDTVAVIREATVRSIILLSPKLSSRILNNDLLRHLARAQTDVEPSIRTNTAILIGRLGPSLSLLSRRKVLVPAFTRAIKDSFVHARVAGLMAFMACGELFEPEDVAKGVLPVVSSTLIDGQKLVRDQAFKTMEYFVKRLEVHASTMPETDQVENPIRSGPQSTQAAIASSAAGAAGALAGWAISSLGKKLTVGDMQTDIGGTERPTSAPLPSAPASTISISNGATLPLPTAGLSVSLAPGGLTGAGTKKGMQLGASKATSGSSTASVNAFVSEWADEEETTNAWDGDLMDVNADADDWSAFETAPVVAVTQPFSLSISSQQVVDDDGWEDEASSPPPALSVPTTTTKKVLSPTPVKASVGRSVSPRTVASASRPISDDGQDTPDTARSQSPKAAVAPSMAGMSKEEKAAEMARRREERKQRIAQLKEQKSKAGQAT
ncbi:armadillo-type protein [Hysterangium stoloniferum]|nr:armadillo-type protein [Hysterangium stoloniferum]